MIDKAAQFFAYTGAVLWCSDAPAVAAVMGAVAVVLVAVHLNFEGGKQ